MLPALAAWVWAACAVAPDARLPERATEPVPELPGAFSEKPDAGAYAPLKWWRAFADPVLDEVVETVLEANLDMAGAVARVEQARVRARLADAAILPAVGVRAGVDSFDVPVNAGIGAQLRELGLEDVLGDGAGGFTLRRVGPRDFGAEPRPGAARRAPRAGGRLDRSGANDRSSADGRVSAGGRTEGVADWPGRSAGSEQAVRAAPQFAPASQVHLVGTG